MTSEMAAPAVPPRMLTAGTTARFVLLLVLLLATSATMISTTAHGVFASNRDVGCMLAAGVDPDDSFIAVGAAPFLQEDAYQACLARFGTGTPWWQTIVWAVVLLVAAAVLFWTLPAWKSRARRVVALDVVDRQGELRARLDELVAASGLRRAPRFVVDPARTTVGALAFGRPGRYTVLLHGGIVAGADPSHVRAVVLHELAHLRNGDVPMTYATVVLWRVFVAGVLLPFVAYDINVLPGRSNPFFPGTLPLVTRDLLLAALMVMLVYLARADVLRSREIYADLDAIAWGADRGIWERRAGAAGRRRLTEWWGTHPRWDVRLRSLSDPAALFGLRALPSFLTGAAAWLFAYQATSSPILPIGENWTERATAAVAAVLVTGIVGVAVWRSVGYAVITSRPVPSGLRTGLWCGAGVAVGDLLTNRLAGNHWVPPHPEALLVIALAVAVITWWTAQCAELCLRPERRTPPGVAAALGLIATGLLFYVALRWWLFNGFVMANGWPFVLGDQRAWLDRLLPDQGASYGGTWHAIALVLPLLLTADPDGLAVWAAQVLWLLPLAAAILGAGAVLPRLRRIFLVAAVGGLSTWLALAAAKAYTHPGRPPAEDQLVEFVLVQVAWAVAAVAVGMMASAAVAAVLVDRYRLLAAYVAAGTAALVGGVGWFLFLALDGCVGPLNSMTFSCAWRPAAGWPLATGWMGYPLLLGMAGATAVALVVVAVRRRPADAQPAPRVPRWARAALAALCAVGIALTAVPATAGDAEDDTSALRPTPSEVFPVQPAASAPKVRALQVDAWSRLGGDALIGQFADAIGEVTASADENGDLDESRLRAACVAEGQTVAQAHAYFLVPDEQGETLWSAVLDNTEKAGADCVRALDNRDGDLLVTALSELLPAADALGALQQRFHEVAMAG